MPVQLDPDWSRLCEETVCHWSVKWDWTGQDTHLPMHYPDPWVDHISRQWLSFSRQLFSPVLSSTLQQPFSSEEAKPDKELWRQSLIIFSISYPKFLLSLWCHKPLLGLLSCCLSLKPGPDLGLLPVNFGLFSTKYSSKSFLFSSISCFTYSSSPIVSLQVWSEMKDEIFTENNRE